MAWQWVAAVRWHSVYEEAKSKSCRVIVCPKGNLKKCIPPASLQSSLYLWQCIQFLMCFKSVGCTLCVNGPSTTDNGKSTTVSPDATYCIWQRGEENLDNNALEGPISPFIFATRHNLCGCRVNQGRRAVEHSCPVLVSLFPKLHHSGSCRGNINHRTLPSMHKRR